MAKIGITSNQHQKGLEVMATSVKKGFFITHFRSGSLALRQATFSEDCVYSEKGGEYD